MIARLGRAELDIEVSGQRCQAMPFGYPAKATEAPLQLSEVKYRHIYCLSYALSLKIQETQLGMTRRVGA
jgi:hypothetical protein